MYIYIMYVRMYASILPYRSMGNVVEPEEPPPPAQFVEPEEPPPPAPS